MFNWQILAMQYGGLQSIICWLFYILCSSIIVQFLNFSFVRFAGGDGKKGKKEEDDGEMETDKSK